MMDPYAELIDMMRNQGAIQNGPGIQLGVMTGSASCKIGDLPIFSEDLYIPDRLQEPVCTKVNIPETHADKSTYSSPLKEGDAVVLYRLSDTKYVILDRVVSGG